MSGHAAVSVYGRLTGDPRAIETRTGNPMTVGRLAVSLPCRENGEDGEAAAYFGLVAFGELAESLARHLKGEFDTGDYVEIMNKASCLSLVSNAILYWNTVKISDIVDRARQQGETINDDDLAHISPLRFRHVRAHGTYFVDEKQSNFQRDYTVWRPNEG